MLEGLEAYSTAGSENQGESKVMTYNDEGGEIYQSIHLCISILSVYFEYLLQHRWNIEKNGRCCEVAKREVTLEDSCLKISLF